MDSAYWFVGGVLAGAVTGGILAFRAILALMGKQAAFGRAVPAPSGCLGHVAGMPAAAPAPEPAQFPAPAIVAPGAARIATRRAVVVGINDFGGDGSANLRYCVLGAQRVRARLIERGWLDRDIVLLTNGDATKPAVVEALRAMFRNARPDDHCFYYQSSHGSQQPDQDGDEADHLDEVLCLHGITKDWDGSTVTDDEFGAILACAPAGGIVTVCLDLCHAGTATREVARSGSVLTARYYERPGGTPDRRIVRRRFGRGPWGHGLRSRSGCAVLVPDMDHRLIAACRDWQTSADSQTDFTHFLLDEENANLPAAEVVAQAEAAMGAAGFSQRPTVEGPQRLLDLPVFA